MHYLGTPNSKLDADFAATSTSNNAELELIMAEPVKSHKSTFELNTNEIANIHQVELKDDVVDKIDELVEQEFMEGTDGDIDQKNVTCSSYIVDKVNATFTISKCEDEMNDAEQLNISSETFTIEKSASELDMRRLSETRENFEGIEEMDQDDLLNNSNETYTVEEKGLLILTAH